MGGKYLVFSGLEGKETLTIEFPMVESKKNTPCSGKMRNSGRNRPIPTMSRLETQGEAGPFYAAFQGNDVSGHHAAPKESAYPLFERNYYLKDKAPLIKVKRFVSSAQSCGEVFRMQADQ